MAEMTGHQTLTYYDPHTDAEAIRISGFDGRGGEFWMKHPRPTTGKSRRELIEASLATIGEAIASGLEPGEVVVDSGV